MAHFSFIFALLVPFLAVVYGEVFQDTEIALEGNPDISFSLDSIKLWPNGRIPFVVEEGMTHMENSRLYCGMAFVKENTCVEFVQKLPEDVNYVQIGKSGSGCYAHVGQVEGKALINLGIGCWQHGTIVHHLLHIIGLVHEQSRADRDDYVEIFWDNIPPQYHRQFEKTSQDVGSYDYASVMHYGSDAFTVFNTNDSLGAKMEPLHFNTELMGNREAPTQMDAHKVNLLYNCPNTKEPTEPQELINDVCRLGPLTTTPAPKPQVINIWPNTPVIPFALGEGITKAEMKQLECAFEFFHKYTCVRFVKKTVGDMDYTEIRKGSSCYGTLGNRGGKSVVSLGLGCWRTGQIIHELMHTLGLTHEHTRADRDQYVEILENNIKDQYLRYFTKGSQKIGSYEYASIMHYGSDAFGFGNETIVAKMEPIEENTNRMGNRLAPTQMDVYKVNLMYGCTTFTKKEPKPNALLFNECMNKE